MLVFSNIALQKNYPKNSVLTTFLHLDGQLGSQESMNEKSTDVCQPSWRKGTFRRQLFELLFEKNYGPASATQPKIFGPKVILPTTPSILETILSSFGPFFDLESPTENIPKTGPRKVTLLRLCGGTKSDFAFVDS